MKLVIFTVEEANQLLAEVKPRLERLMALKRDFDRVQSAVEVATVAASGATPLNPDAKELRRLLERRHGLAEQLSAGVAAIHRRGCLVKDLDHGLLDFYALSGDRLIFLCWRMGETEITHWHTLGGGFQSRQPLNHTELD